MCDRFGIIDGGKMIDIKTIGDIKKNETITIKSYKVEVDNKEKALELISSNHTNVKPEILEDGIKVTCEKEELAKINKELVLNYISLFMVTLLTKTLEDEFMEVTKGAKDQIR